MCFPLFLPCRNVWLTPEGDRHSKPVTTSDTPSSSPPPILAQKGGVVNWSPLCFQSEQENIFLWAASPPGYKKKGGGNKGLSPGGAVMSGYVVVRISVLVVGCVVVWDGNLCVLYWGVWRCMVMVGRVYSIKVFYCWSCVISILMELVTSVFSLYLLFNTLRPPPYIPYSLP